MLLKKLDNLNKNKKISQFRSVVKKEPELELLSMEEITN